jgi:hypothetical protein
MKKLIAALVLQGFLTGSIISAPIAAGGARQQTDPQTKPEQPKAPRPKPAPIEIVKRYLQRLGDPIDESKSTPEMVVSSYSDTKKGKVTIVVVYDKKKDLIGLYIYNFGNLKNAPDVEAVNRYLLSANDALTIGAFFVDSDKDIGYKYLMPAQQLGLATFESIYLTVALIAIDRRLEIRKLLGLVTETEDKQPEKKDN